ncbi:aminoglycoside phosphotransferase family protein [Brevibacillus sp. FSL L8-0520]|jgi:aminoglycoside phosphotransferase (APT) family kinase protein|uniref:aminoglycoside phosphotransferase family protein n=1 Tax=Brevibacillus sp. FSL L8-0520 TaxID=2954689 RepID=UPI0030D03CDF
MNDILQAFRENIPALAHASDIRRIAEGFSPDQKYVVSYDDGTKLLLRTADLKQYERKYAEYGIMEAIQMYGAKSPQPIDIGRLEQSELCYYLLSYIDGEDARGAIPDCTPEKQYRIGWDAGQDLAKLHQHPAPHSISSWYERATRKHHNYVEAYKTCGVKMENDARIIRFIDEHQKLLKARPNKFQHDDFHVGNMIVHEKRYAGVIDFNRFDWGDPIHDFYKLALFSKECSIPFSVGQIEGYFYVRGIPADFWTLYAVYAAMSIFSAIVWTVRVTPEKVDEMVERLHSLCEDHRYFETCKPDWFKE